MEHYHLGNRLHSLVGCIFVSTRIRLNPTRSKLSLVGIARLGGLGLTLIASELKLTVDGSENKE